MILVDILTHNQLFLEHLNTCQAGNYDYFSSCIYQNFYPILRHPAFIQFLYSIFIDLFKLFRFNWFQFLSILFMNGLKYKLNTYLIWNIYTPSWPGFHLFYLSVILILLILSGPAFYLFLDYFIFNLFNLYLTILQLFFIKISWNYCYNKLTIKYSWKLILWWGRFLFID